MENNENTENGTFVIHESSGQYSVIVVKFSVVAVKSSDVVKSSVIIV